MRTVRDESGDRYLLLAESGGRSRVRDPETGEVRVLPTDRLEPVDGASPLETAGEAVPKSLRSVLTAVHDERALGLLLEIDRRGPIDVRSLLAYDRCESDLHGLLAELRAAGLLAETDANGRRGYRTTDAASDALAVLVGDSDHGTGGDRNEDRSH